MTPTWLVPPGRSGNSTLPQAASRPLDGKEPAVAGPRNCLTARTALNGAESYGFCEEGAALDFLQDGCIEFEGELPLNTSGGSLGMGRIRGLWHIMEGARCRPRAAPDRARSRTPTSFVVPSTPIVTGTTFISVGGPY
jgi:thiolase-like protein